MVTALEKEYGERYLADGISVTCNLLPNGELDFWAQPPGEGHTYYPSNVVDFSSSLCFASSNKHESNAEWENGQRDPVFLEFHFVHMIAIVSGYTLRARWDYNNNEYNYCPQQWTLRASMERMRSEEDGIEIDSSRNHAESDIKALASKVGATQHFSVQRLERCRYLRFTMKGLSAKAWNGMALGAFEMFGTLLPVTSED